MVQKQLKGRQVNIPPEAILRKQVLDHLIDVELQLQVAKSNNIHIDQEGLNEALANIAERHNMTLAKLRQSIKSQGIPWEQYRANIKKEILISKFQQQAIDNVVVEKSEVDDYLKSNKHKQHLQFHIKDIVISLPEAPSPKQIKQAKAQALKLIEEVKQGLNFSDAAVARSSGQFALEGGDLGYRSLAGLPKMFADKVVNMKKGDIAGPIRAPNGFHVIKLMNIKGQQTKKMVWLSNVRHILLTVDNGMSSQDVRKKIYKIYKQIKAGKSFAQMAKKYSVDPKSAPKGGELGWIHDGETVPMFELVMNKLKVGEVSEPVRTSVGWHLIKVEARKKIDDTKVYQRQLVKQQLYQRKFLAAVQNYLQQLRANSYVKVM